MRIGNDMPWVGRVVASAKRRDAMMNSSPPIHRERRKRPDPIPVNVDLLSQVSPKRMMSLASDTYGTTLSAKTHDERRHMIPSCDFAVILARLLRLNAWTSCRRPTRERS